MCYNIFVYIYEREVLFSLNGILERLGGLFNKDKFEAELKNALKRSNFTVSSKSEDGIYDVTNGSASFKIDAGKAREIYEKNHSEDELDSFIKKLRLECDMESRMVSFTNGQAFLRFVVMRGSDVKNNMVYEDFADGLKKVVVYTADDTELHYLEESCLKRWAVPREVAVSVADRNMCRLLAKAEKNQSEIADGISALEFELPSKRLATSLMMCNDFRRTVYDFMGAKFLVVAPSEESLLILGNITNNILEGLGKVIIEEYQKAEHPLTTDVLLFTPNDIQIAGHFSVKDTRSADEAGRSLK